MITISAAGHTTFETAATTLVVQAASDHPVARSLAQAVATADGTFRSLAQVVVENGFEAPAFVCIRREDENLHLFLFGSVRARVAPPAEATLDGTGTSTWTEHTVPANVDVVVEWSETDGTAAGRTSSDGWTTPEPPEAPAAPEAPVTQIPASPPTPVPAAEPPHQPIAPEPDVSSVVPEPIPPTRPILDPPPALIPDPAEVADPPAMPDPNLLGTDLLAVASIDDPDVAPDPLGPAESSPVPDGPPLPIDAPDSDATIDADALRQSISEEAPAPTSAKSPLVTARVCACGAPNPLGGEDCMSCGSSLRREGVTISQVPRPSLGCLVLDDGTRLPLDDSFVIGRNVPATHEVAGRPCPGISVESPTKQVSKVHLEVRLVDWTLNVVDLDSANGTYVEDSTGRSPRRLRPNVVEQVLPGDNVHFGDRSFVFEAIAGL